MILNDIERTVLCNAREYRTNAEFMDAIEAAVIAKLSQGVEMPEPKWGQGRYLGSAMHRDAYTADQLRTVAAAARVKALGEATVIATPSLPRPCDCEVCDCGNSGDYARVVDWDSSNNLANAIRKLKGTTP